MKWLERRWGSGCHGTLLSLAPGPAGLRCACGPFSVFRTALRMQRTSEPSSAPAYNDVQYQGRYEWLPQYNDPPPLRAQVSGPGTNLVVELAPKVLDGTRCTADSLDMCISGICQVSHTYFPGPCLQPVLQPLSVKITFLLYFSSCRWNIAFEDFNVKHILRSVIHL